MLKLSELRHIRVRLEAFVDNGEERRRSPSLLGLFCFLGRVGPPRAGLALRIFGVPDEKTPCAKLLWGLRKTWKELNGMTTSRMSVFAA